MGSLGLTDDLSQEDCSEDLGLAFESKERIQSAQVIGSNWVPKSRHAILNRLTKGGHSSPGIEGLHGGKRFEGNITAEHSWEMPSSCLDQVSGGGKHGNSAVLKFGSPEPSQSGFRSQSGKVKRIPGSNGLGGSSHITKGREGRRGGDLNVKSLS